MIACQLRGGWMTALMLSAPLAAHMVSISSGEATVEGNRIRYVLRMPLYEVAHVKDPERALLDSIRFRSGGSDGRVVERSCRRDDAEAALICEARLEFSSPVDLLEASSTLHQITVPNHVHLLRATREGKNDQAVLDLTFPRAELRFRPPTLVETATRELLGGVMRAISGPAQWLFLIALVIAARSRRELVLFTGMFVLGEALAAAALPAVKWAPAPRFVEVACALTIAYLAVEVLWLPQAGQRWLVVCVLGGFHGLYFATFISESGFSPVWVLAGAFFAEALGIGLLAWLLAKLLSPAKAVPLARWASMVLLVVGLSWFFWRLRG